MRESGVVNNISVDSGFLGAPTPGVEGDPTPLKDEEKECNIVTGGVSILPSGSPLAWGPTRERWGVFANST